MPTQTPPELEAILSELHTAVSAQATTDPARRRLRPQRRLVLAAPLVVAVAAALYVGLGVGNEQPASAARQLQHAAKLVAASPAPVIGPGQYWYVKGLGAFANRVATGKGTFTALRTARHEIWIASDASGRVVRTDGPPQFFSAAERARWEGAGKPGFESSGGIDETVAAGELSWGIQPLARKVADIPSDPEVLARLIEQHANENKNTTAQEAFSLIEEVLRFAPLSGAQTAAFYQVLASLHGIEVAGAARDGLGRSGTAFTLADGGPTRQELILDPETGRLLGSRTTLTAPDPSYEDAAIGTVLSYETIVSTGVVGSTDARP
jgi:RNA polymerase sigma-70 factor (ECF subfamily)